MMRGRKVSGHRHLSPSVLLHHPLSSSDSVPTVHPASAREVEEETACGEEDEAKATNGLLGIDAARDPFQGAGTTMRLAHRLGTVPARSSNAHSCAAAVLGPSAKSPSRFHCGSSGTVAG
jgi:hypothetical protein